MVDDTITVIPTEFEGTIRCLAFSPDSNYILVAAKRQMLPNDNVLDDAVELWDIPNLRCIARYPHDGIVQSVTFSSDGTLGICCTGNGKISVWQLDRTAPIRVGHSAFVVKAVVRPAGGSEGYAFTASIDGSLLVWKLRSLSVERKLFFKTPLRAMDVDCEGARVLTFASEDSWVQDELLFTNAVELRRSEGTSEPTKLFAATSAINYFYRVVLFIPGRPWAFLSRVDLDDAGGSEERVELWDINVCRRVARAKKVRFGVTSAVSIDDGLKVMTTSLRHLCVWSVGDLEAGPQIIAEREYQLTAIVLSDCGKVAAVAGGGYIEIWDVLSLVQVSKFLAGNSRIAGLCFVDGSRYVASCGPDHCVRVWDRRNGAHCCSFYGDGALTSVAWAEMARTIVATEETGEVHFLRFEGLLA